LHCRGRAHITAASPGGPRYDGALSTAARAEIENGIWLCETHAKLIDDEGVTWSVPKLRETKRLHEEYVAERVGVPHRIGSRIAESAPPARPRGPSPREYAFLPAKHLIDPYKTFISPILEDKGLAGDVELGVLMCGTDLDQRNEQDNEPQWTVFVNADWLRWYLAGREFGRSTIEIPGEQIYGQISAWPDGFFEFLAALVMTNGVFVWRRHPNGYLVLCQPEPERR
jgi:hypothetical protein